jgi:hypothetical protein
MASGGMAAGQRGGRGTVPEARRTVCGREADQAGKFPRVHQRELRLGSGRAGATAIRPSARAAAGRTAAGRRGRPIEILKISIEECPGAKAPFRAGVSSLLLKQGASTDPGPPPNLP